MSAGGSGSAPIQPQTGQPEASPDAKTIAETQKEIAELQKVTAEAQKAAVEALLPTPKLEPQEGKTEAEGKFGYTAQLIAYQVLKEKAKQIGREIDSKLDEKKRQRILIVHDLDVATDDLPLIHWEALVKQLEASIAGQLKSNKDIIDSVVRPTRSALAPITLLVPALVGLASDIMGYFKTDYRVVGLEFSLNDHALYANMISSITKVPVYIFGFHLLKKSDVFDDFKKLLTRRTELAASLETLRSIVVKKTQDEIGQTEQDIRQLEVSLQATKTEAETQDVERQLRDERVALENRKLVLAQVNAAISASETIISAFASFAESVTKTPDDKSPPLLLKAALRRWIRETRITHLLSLKILSAGGDGVTTKLRLGKSGRMIFIAGCAISYILVKTDGTYVLADTHHALAHLNYDLGTPPQFLAVQPINTEAEKAPRR